MNQASEVAAVSKGGEVVAIQIFRSKGDAKFLRHEHDELHEPHRVEGCGDRIIGRKKLGIDQCVDGGSMRGSGRYRWARGLKLDSLAIGKA